MKQKNLILINYLQKQEMKSQEMIIMHHILW